MPGHLPQTNGQVRAVRAVSGTHRFMVHGSAGRGPFTEGHPPYAADLWADRGQVSGAGPGIRSQVSPNECSAMLA
jgi:hypothetical protein